jgi:hypothetical protein
MAAEKYVKIDLTTGRLTQQQAVDVGGSGNAGKIVALNSAGFVDPTMLTDSGGGGSTINVIADVNLSPGDWVNIFYTSSQRRARKATATDATIPAHAFVQDTISATSSGLAYLDTINPYCVRGSLTTSDIGKRVFLSTTGGSYTLTPPSTTGNLIQVLGVIVDVNTTSNLVQVDAEINDGYVV